MRRTYLLIFILVLSAMASAGELSRKKPVLLGMTTALTGPTSFLGQQMRAGVEIYLHRVNFEGGVKGRRIELAVLDDGYRKDIAVMNMNCLMDRNVLAVIGNVGTPTAIVTRDIAGAHQRLFFGAYTGTTRLRNEFEDDRQSPDRLVHVANYRASYYDELEKIITELLKLGICPGEIGLFAQKGEWGEELTAHVERIYREKGYAFAKPAVGLYRRNTTDIHEAVFSLLECDRQFKAIILAGPYFPSAKCLRTLKPIMPDATFFGLSFMGAESFVEELKEEANGVVLTQVVPSLLSDLPVIRRFKKDLNHYAESREFKEAYGANIHADHFLTHVALEGYIVAMLFTKVLNKADDLDTPQRIIAAMDGFKGKPVDIGMFNPSKKNGKSATGLKWDDRKRQFSDHVWAAIVKDGRLEPFNWDNLPNAVTCTGKF